MIVAFVKKERLVCACGKSVLLFEGSYMYISLNAYTCVYIYKCVSEFVHWNSTLELSRTTSTGVNNIDYQVK